MAPLNLSDPQFKYDPEDPEGFRAGMFRLGGLVGAERTGTTLYELPPGELLCPYHYEYGEEEWLLVLERTPVPPHAGRHRGAEAARRGLLPARPEGRPPGRATARTSRRWC